MNDNSLKINDNTLSMESWVEQQTMGNDENGKKNLSERKKEAKHNDSESKAQQGVGKNKEDLKRQDENDSEMAIKKEISKINECANCTNLDETKDYTIIVPPRKKMRNMTNEEAEGGSPNGGKANGEESFIPTGKSHSSEQEYITELLQSSSFDLKHKKKKLKKKSACDGGKRENGQGGKSGKNKSNGKNKPKGKSAKCEKKYGRKVDQSSDEGGAGESIEGSGEDSGDDSGDDSSEVVSEGSNPLAKRKGKKADKQKKLNMLREKLNKTKKINFKKEKNSSKNDKQRYAKYKRNKENIKMTFDVTSRFTVLGCDWDNISSADIFYLFESYYNFEKRKKKNIDYTKSRAVKKVTIYTSKYGEKKLKQEKRHGPKINLDILKLKRKGDGAVYRQNNFLDYLQDEEDEEGALSSSEDSSSEGGTDESGSNDESVESDESEERDESDERDESADLDEGADRDDSTGDDESADSDSSAGHGAKGKKKASTKEGTTVRGPSKGKLKKKPSEEATLHTSHSADEEEENEKIRLYQIQRSRYYFAVVECYNKEIVEFLYEELNDMDADFCINYLDLRIIDDSCSLDDYKVKEACTKIPENYQFHYSVSTPLKHTHAKPTWDENPKRKKLLSTRFTEEKLRELDLKEYLANSSSSDEEEEEEDADEEEKEQGKNRNKDNSPPNKREKYNREDYRKLLLGDWLNEDDTESAQKEEPNWGVAKTSGKGTRGDDLSKMNLSMYLDEMEEDFADKEGVTNLSKGGTFASKKNVGGSVKNELAQSYHEKGGEKNKHKGKGSGAATAKAADEVGEVGDAKDDDDSDNENEVVQVFKNMLKNKDQKEEKKNPWDKYLDRVRQKKKLKKKAYLESLKKKDEEIKKIITKKTNKRKKDVMFKGHGENLLEKVNDGHIIDSRFADLYKNKDFNLDITNPNFKKTKFNEDILQKKKL
ncbi:hypothetical protein, conserved [Plasmodium vivax]|uniref:Uncharacterized protein n=1 Tax=Plasmodium vivax (strain Salvador I) TaxID=126793 RepID=A5K0H1_PLAVS|nr:hypothetical protein, conserved [Plasmodium vivax]EDL46818.1 hypothetical protein, conserved [Plasmodium vivax]|eukprot:XP_001616545.1 hypothetical protein [Plasmodium vivax Sal-1]